MTFAQKSLPVLPVFATTTYIAHTLYIFPRPTPSAAVPMNVHDASEVILPQGNPSGLVNLEGLRESQEKGRGTVERLPSSVKRRLVSTCVTAKQHRQERRGGRAFPRELILQLLHPPGIRLLPVRGQRSALARVPLSQSLYNINTLAPYEYINAYRKSGQAHNTRRCSRFNNSRQRRTLIKYVRGSNPDQRRHHFARERLGYKNGIWEVVGFRMGSGVWQWVGRPRGFLVGWVVESQRTLLFS